MSGGQALTVSLGPILTINSNWRKLGKNISIQDNRHLSKRKYEYDYRIFNGKLLKSNVK